MSTLISYQKAYFTKGTSFPGNLATFAVPGHRPHRPAIERVPNADEGYRLSVDAEPTSSVEQRNESKVTEAFANFDSTLSDPYSPQGEYGGLEESSVLPVRFLPPRYPPNLEEALNHPQWKKAMIEEMEALKKNDTWELITLPRGKRTVGCRWVYTLKHKADGSIERARIVARGFTQTYSIDYLETFAPVAKLNSIPYESFCQLQLTDLGHCISSMSKRPFFMETSANRSVARSGSLTETGTRHGKARSMSSSPEVRNVEVPFPSPVSSVRHSLELPARMPSLPCKANLAKQWKEKGLRPSLPRPPGREAGTHLIRLIDRHTGREGLVLNLLLEAPVRNVEVKEGAHPSDSGGKYEKAAVPDLASSNGSNLEEEALVELSEVRKKHPIGISSAAAPRSARSCAPLLFPALPFFARKRACPLKGKVFPKPYVVGRGLVAKLASTQRETPTTDKPVINMACHTLGGGLAPTSRCSYASLVVSRSGGRMNRMSKEGELSKLMNKLNIAKGRWVRALRVSGRGLKTDLDNDVLERESSPAGGAFRGPDQHLSMDFGLLRMGYNPARWSTVPQASPAAFIEPNLASLAQYETLPDFPKEDAAAELASMSIPGLFLFRRRSRVKPRIVIINVALRAENECRNKIPFFPCSLGWEQDAPLCPRRESTALHFR
uniref:Reverse transcriptase Ty1/copia-type domain-containing protein n=2 Tax=Fagus sylvatica TaxID=28930 RepID=A0A2N9GHF6_FAGSY